MKVHAQELMIDGVKITGPLKKDIGTIGDLISVVLSFLFPFAALILLMMLIWGGYSFMTSAGDLENVAGAKAKITTAIIGFVLLVLSFFLVRVVAFVFGLDGSLLF